jgi:drug/metabolite transporter (DMT)-like permease
MILRPRLAALRTGFDMSGFDWLPANSFAGVSPVRRFLLYGLALVAAVTWAVYSTLLARWRDWARNYVTSPVGFLLTGPRSCTLPPQKGS